MSYKYSHERVFMKKKWFFYTIILLLILQTVSAVPQQITTAGAESITIPRYKIFQSFNDPNDMWLIFPNGGGNNFIKSVDGGQTWDAADPSIHIPRVSDHASAGGDNQDNVYIADRCGPCTEATQLIFSKVNAPGESSGDLNQIIIDAPFSGSTNTPNILVQDSNNVFIIMRLSRPDGQDASEGNIYYARSTNGGISFDTPQLLYATGASKVRIGSFLINGIPAVALHYISSVGNPNRDYQYFIWDGNQFIENSDSIVVSGENTGNEREYSMSYVNGQLHLVYNNGQDLKHAWKDYNGGTDSWNNQVIESRSYDPRDWHPSLTKHGNDLYMFYVRQESSTNGDNTIYYRKWDSTTSTWSSPTQISQSNSNVRFPHGPAEVPASSTFIPVTWSANSNSIWFDTIDVSGQPSNNPPVISNVLCETESGGTVTCDQVVYGDIVINLMADCTDDGSVSNVNFLLENIDDNSQLVDGDYNNNVDDTFLLENINLDIIDSGDFRLTITCTDNGSLTDTEIVSWSIPWGTLETFHNNPNNNTVVDNGETFLYNTTVTCNGGECGNITATLDPIFGNNNTEPTERTSGASVRCGIFELMDEGIVRNISYYGHSLASSSCAAAIYNSTSTTPSILLSESSRMLHDTSTEWKTFTIPNPLLSPGYYALCITCEQDITFYELDDAGTMVGIQSPQDPFPDPFPTPLQWERPWLMSIYAGYDNGTTPSGGGGGGGGGGHIAKTIIPMNSGRPFYTTNQNPVVCQDMKADDVCDTAWNVTVNATGGNYTFFVLYEPDYPINSSNSDYIEVIINSCVETMNVINMINDWYNGAVSIGELVSLLKQWEVNSC
jgi:hypothetical protein